jgi:hypothetical protein
MNLRPGQLPAAEQLFPLWEAYLTAFDSLEDDRIPSLYPNQYDQGIYGTLFGAQMHVNQAGLPNGASSNSLPLEDKTYPELLQLALHPDDEWVTRMESDLRCWSAKSAGRWGIAVPITIDGFNLCMQIRGNQTMLDIYDRPGELKCFLQAGVKLNIDLVERARAAIGMGAGGGVYDFFNAGWMPGNAVPMSVDCYNMCGAEIYGEFGRPYQQQLIDHFGGGNFHVHGNARHLLPELARLKGCIVAAIGDDGSPVSALDDLEEIKNQIGLITPVVACSPGRFRQKLHDRSLMGGVYYDVGPLPDIDEANRLMDWVRRYRC